MNGILATPALDTPAGRGAGQQQHNQGSERRGGGGGGGGTAPLLWLAVRGTAQVLGLPEGVKKVGMAAAST